MLSNLYSLARSLIDNRDRELVLLEVSRNTLADSEFYQPNFTAIDFETANKNRNSACSLAIVVVENNEIVFKKHWYINPQTDDFYFTYLHGIKKSTVKNAPTLAELWQSELKDYIDGKIIAAHNAPFDISVLNTTLQEAGISLPKIQSIDTVQYSRQYFPHLQNHKLSTVADFLNIPLNHHNAMSDAEACAQIILKLNNKEYNSIDSLKTTQLYADEGKPLFNRIKSKIDSNSSTNLKSYYNDFYLLQRCLSEVESEKDTSDAFAAKVFRLNGDIYLKCQHYAGAIFFYSLAYNLYDRSGVKRTLEMLEKNYPTEYARVEQMIVNNSFDDELFINKAPNPELKKATTSVGCLLPIISVLMILALI